MLIWAIHYICTQWVRAAISTCTLLLHPVSSGCNFHMYTFVTTQTIKSEPYTISAPSEFMLQFPHVHFCYNPNHQTQLSLAANTLLLQPKPSNTTVTFCYNPNHQTQLWLFVTTQTIKHNCDFLLQPKPSNTTVTFCYNPNHQTQLWLSVTTQTIKHNCVTCC